MNACLFFLVGVLVFAVQPNSTDVQLHGTWTFKTGTANGRAIALPERTLWRFTFGKENKLLIRKTADPDKLAKFVISPEKGINEIDVTFPGEDGGKPVTSAGIFKIENDSLTVALPISETRKRPLSFEPKQEIILLTFQKQKPGTGDDIPAMAPKPMAKVSGNESPLAGRWELFIEQKAEKGVSERIEIEFQIKKKSIKIRRETTTPLVGKLKLDGKHETGLIFVPDPDGGKDVFGVVENVAKEKDSATIRHIRFHFQGEILEMLGEVRPPGFEAINFTGQWKRVPEKK